VTFSESDRLIRRGAWLYAGLVRREVRVVRQMLFFGTGDHEDPEEIAADRECTCYGVQFETSTGESPDFVGGGQFATLAAAIQHVEGMGLAGFEWLD
jgi:hypothetical protein